VLRYATLADFISIKDMAKRKSLHFCRPKGFGRFSVGVQLIREKFKWFYR
jgi:hypothetical protein